MKIIEKIAKKQSDLRANPAVTIGLLGDSVTQGCFECYTVTENSLDTVFDYEHAYGTRLKEMLNLLFPNVQINVINAGISGDSAPGGLARLDRDILAYNPDLVIVGFALNDACSGTAGLNAYKTAMAEILRRIKEKGAECIVLTPNYMNTQVSCHLKEELFRNLAERFAEIQNGGTLDAYVNALKEVADENGVKVCDVYSKWKKMAKSGVNVTELLANKLNHPIRPFHYLTAMMLCDCMMD